MPAIVEALRDLGGANVFSTIDLKSVYGQNPAEEASRYLTAFATPDGATYQFRVMTFGLKNAPDSFQRMMVLAGFLHKFTLVYLDNIIVFNPDWATPLPLIFEASSSVGSTVPRPNSDLESESWNTWGTSSTPTEIDHDRYTKKPYVWPKTREQLRQFIREYVQDTRGRDGLQPYQTSHPATPCPAPT